MAKLVQGDALSGQSRRLLLRPKNMPKTSNATPNVAPLRITISDLICNNPSRTKGLSAVAFDPSQRLGPLCHAINNNLEAAGFVDPAFKRHSQRHQFQSPCVSLLNIRVARKTAVIHCKKHPGKLRRAPAQLIDACGLVEQYRGHI